MGPDARQDTLGWTPGPWEPLQESDGAAVGGVAGGGQGRGVGSPGVPRKGCGRGRLVHLSEGRESRGHLCSPRPLSLSSASCSRNAPPEGGRERLFWCVVCSLSQPPPSFCTVFLPALQAPFRCPFTLSHLLRDGMASF